MFICGICNKEFKNSRGLSQHLRYSHKEISKKEYYDKYLKIAGDGICPVCNNETNFVNRGLGYYPKHCSINYINKNVDTKNKIKKSKLDKYGMENNTQLDYYKKLNSDIWKNKTKDELHEILNKSKNTCLDKYGVDNPAKSEIIKQQMKDTCLEKFGTEYALQNKNVIETRKQTNIIKYGCENVFQNEKIKEKIRTKLVERGYKVLEEDYNIFKNYYKKCMSLTKINIRKFNFLKSWSGYDYYDGELIIDNYKLYKPNNENYPNIDHKISIIYGFLNNIEIDIISDIKNLCITKRKYNSSKRHLTEDEYKKKKES